MDSHTESEEGNMNDRAKALAAAAAAASLPGINYMTARFPMAPGVDMPIMHHIGMPFFSQPGSQFLAPGLSTMPMFLHPASLQRPGQPSSSPVKEVRPNIQQQTDLNQVAQGVISHPVLQFPSIYMPQQLTHLPSLSEVQEEAGGAMDGIDKRSPGGHENLMLPFNFFSNMGQQGMQLTMPQPLQQQQQPLHAPPQQLVTGKEDTLKALKQPKRALTPYMRFSKEIWQRVKAQNPDLSVCAIGAAIGRMWRELPAIEKEKYNEEFSADKIRYEDELQRYLKATGLQASDLAKSSRNRKKESSAPYPQQSGGGTVMQQLQAANSRQQQQNEHEQQQLAATTGLPAFSQIWAAGGVPMMNMVGQQTGVEQQLGGDAGRDSGEQGQSDAAMWQQLQDDDPSGQQPPPMYNLLTIQHVERTRHDGAPPAQAMTWHRPGNIRPEIHPHASPKRHDPTGFGQGLGSNGSRMMLPNGTLLPNNDKKVEAGDSWDILGLSSFADKQQQQQMLEASGSVNGGSRVLLADVGALEAEVGQLRHALSEKTREAQRLASELEQAHELIMQLQQQMAAPATDVIQDATEDMQMTVGQEQLAEGAGLLCGQADDLQQAEHAELAHEQQLGGELAGQQQMYLQENLQQPELVYEQQDGVCTMEGLSDTQQVDQQEFQQPDMLYQHTVTVTEQQQLSGEEQELQQNALTASGQMYTQAESLFQQKTLSPHQGEMLQQEQVVLQGEIAPEDDQVYQVQEELPLQTEFSRPEKNEFLQREQLLPQSQMPEQQHQDEVLRGQQEQLQQDEQELSLSEQVTSVHHDSLQQQCTELPEQQELQQGNELIKPIDVQSRTDDQQHIDKHLPVSEYAQPESEHVQPVSEYVQPVSEHVQPVSEHIQALPDHLQFVSEHQAQPVSEQRIDAEQVRAENASVEEHKLGLDWAEELSSGEVGDNVQ